MQLCSPLQRALEDLRYQNPTPIQARAIPPALEGQDVLGCAQTGTGKTAAFALPILEYLAIEQPPLVANRPTSLVLAPTRELAIQIGDKFRDYGKHIQFRKGLLFGGVGQSAQVNALRRGVDLLIATPGRLIDLMQQGHVDLASVEIFVLDEADRMLDMGFLPALKTIIKDLPQQRQSLFFSATLAPKIRKLASELLFNPVSVTVAPQETSVKGIRQSVRFVQRATKFASLRGVLQRERVDRAIVFTRTKHGADALTRKLNRDGVEAAAIHGNKSQRARQKTLESFRNRIVSTLVATDVAARGIDVAGVSHVINYDVPTEPESYVHRIGRTGRAGEKGVAVSLCTEQELEELRAIEKLLGHRLDRENPKDDLLSDTPESQKQKGRGKTQKSRSGAGNASSRSRNRNTVARGKKAQRSGKRPKAAR